MGNFVAKDSAFRLAGQLQLDLLARSPYKTGRRFLHTQWCWALGHIGLLWQLIRWFRLREPKTQLVLAAEGSANPYFLQALAPFLTFIHPSELIRAHADEAMQNAVYFGCPDGVSSLVNFNKQIERDCAGDEPLKLGDDQVLKAVEFRDQCWEGRPFVAVHARHSDHDAARNVTVEQIETALEPWKSRGYSVISTGLDPHPINERYPSVRNTAEPHHASFLLSANCDHFIGSNSGAWTIAHAYGRPVTLLNDYERSAWIYP